MLLLYATLREHSYHMLPCFRQVVSCSKNVAYWSFRAELEFLGCSSVISLDDCLQALQRAAQDRSSNEVSTMWVACFFCAHLVGYLPLHGTNCTSAYQIPLSQVGMGPRPVLFSLELMNLEPIERPLF